MLGIPDFTTREEELLHHSEIDVVVILTPMREHARLATLALKAGKHVLLEKPLATSFEEGAELVRLAESLNLHLLCAPFTPLSPTFQTLSRRIRNGDIGKPCLARSRYGWAGPWWNEWFYKTGGGAIADLGVYGITTLTGLLGPVHQVTAMAGTAIREREINGQKVQVEVNDNAQVLLDFGESCFAVVTTGFTIQQYRSPALEIYGTTGTIQMLGDDWDPDGYELWQNSAGCWQTFKETHPEWSWTDGLNHLVHCLRNGTRCAIASDHALHVLEILALAVQSARESRAFRLTTRFDPLITASSKSAPGAEAHLDHDRTREHFS